MKYNWFEATVKEDPWRRWRDIVKSDMSCWGLLRWHYLTELGTGKPAKPAKDTAG